MAHAAAVFVGIQTQTLVDELVDGEIRAATLDLRGNQLESSARLLLDDVLIDAHAHALGFEEYQPLQDQLFEVMAHLGAFAVEPQLQEFAGQDRLASDPHDLAAPDPGEAAVPSDRQHSLCRRCLPASLPE